VDPIGDDRDGFAFLAAPGSLPWGRSPYGVDDMAGNVREWVTDYYAESGYADLPSINPVRNVAKLDRTRVVRGGSWLTPRFLGLTFIKHGGTIQRGLKERSRSIDVGFRCAMDLR
jgi:formylglycine-generating enzyme required for sulfatase activity